MFAAASRFIILKNLSVSHVDATTAGSFFEDAVMKIEYVSTFPSNFGNVRSNSDSPVGEEDSTNYYSNPQNSASPDSLGKIIWPIKKMYIYLSIIILNLFFINRKLCS